MPKAAFQYGERVLPTQSGHIKLLTTRSRNLHYQILLWLVPIHELIFPGQIRESQNLGSPLPWMPPQAPQPTLFNE